MKPSLRNTIIALAIAIVCYYTFGYINSYFSWYAREPWKYRKGTMDIAESRKRNVFIKELHFKVEGYSGNLYGFTPYIEKAFTYGYHTSEETIIWSNTRYPYQIAFSYVRSSNFGAIITQDGLSKFDSSNAAWGYLIKPKLSDTIIVEIGGEQIPRGALIKVFE